MEAWGRRWPMRTRRLRARGDLPRRSIIISVPAGAGHYEEQQSLNSLSGGGVHPPPPGQSSYSDCWRDGEVSTRWVPVAEWVRPSRFTATSKDVCSGCECVSSCRPLTPQRPLKLLCRTARRLDLRCDASPAPWSYPLSDQSPRQHDL